MEGFTQSHKKKVEVRFELALKYADLGGKNEWERPYETVPIGRFVQNAGPLLDHYLHRFCSITGGFAIEVDGEPWIDGCDTSFWWDSWFCGLANLLDNCPRAGGKFSDEYPAYDLGLEDLFQPRVFGAYFHIVEVDSEEKSAWRTKHSDLDHEFEYIHLANPVVEVLLEEHARLSFGPVTGIGKPIGDYFVMYYVGEIWIINALTDDHMGIKGFGGPEDYAVSGHEVHITPWEQSNMRLYCYKDEVKISDYHISPYWVPLDQLVEGLIREGSKLAIVSEEIHSLIQEAENTSTYAGAETLSCIRWVKKSFSDNIGKEVDLLARAYENWKTCQRSRDSEKELI